MILDATAGYRMMWFNKNHKDTVYLDQRRQVGPDLIAVWKALPFRDQTFDLVVFDPPHGSNGQKGVFADRYGTLLAHQQFPFVYWAARELLRVLKKGGSLIFKWNTHDKSLPRILQAFPIKPLFGQKTAYKTKHSSSTFWVYFKKEMD